MGLLPLPEEVLRRLGFLGLRTLGQYAALPPPAVWQQFRRAGKLAQRFARGEDDRLVVPRWQAPRLAAAHDFEVPVNNRARLVAALNHLVGPLATELQENLQVCGEARLTVRFADGSRQERGWAFLSPTADKGRILWASPAAGALDCKAARALPRDAGLYADQRRTRNAARRADSAGGRAGRHPPAGTDSQGVHLHHTGRRGGARGPHRAAKIV